jgi:hypothetical protein
MNNFKLGRGYIDNSIRRHTINLEEINIDDVEWFTNRLRQSLRREIPMDYYRREIRHQFYETIRVRGLNNNEDTIEDNINQ